MAVLPSLKMAALTISALRQPMSFVGHGDVDQGGPPSLLGSQHFGLLDARA